MAKTKTGHAIRRSRRRPAQLKGLDEFILQAQLKNDLGEWRRGRAVRAYIDGRRVIEIAADFGVTRGSVNRWLQWYDADHVEGLRTSIAEGPTPKLTEEQRKALTVVIELGPIQAGYQSGVWTGPMIGDLIEQRFGVRYHNHHVPRLLHQLRFSVQRPRKRLARADLARQATWLRETLPKIKKSAPMPRRRCFRDEASFWLDGTLHQTWSRVGCQPRVDTFGMRKTAHVFGIVTLEQRPRFLYQFAPVFNGLTFLDFLKEIVRRSRRRKTFLIIDNGPCHNLDANGKLWLASHRHRIELFRLPPYSPELNAIEGVWKVTKKRTTHNRFYKTTEERDAALCSTFGTFQARPKLIANHVARFL